MEKILMYPTFEKAINEWKEICRKAPNLIKKARRDKLIIELINGNIYYFRSPNQGIRGYRAEIVYYDEFFDINKGKKDEQE